MTFPAGDCGVSAIEWKRGFGVVKMNVSPIAFFVASGAISSGVVFLRNTTLVFVFVAIHAVTPYLTKMPVSVFFVTGRTRGGLMCTAQGKGAGVVSFQGVGGLLKSVVGVAGLAIG